MSLCIDKPTNHYVGSLPTGLRGSKISAHVIMVSRTLLTHPHLIVNHWNDESGTIQ